jgi:hypothetical protein
MQAELADLEAELMHLIREDKASSDEAQSQFDRHFFSLREMPQRIPPRIINTPRQKRSDRN